MTTVDVSKVLFFTSIIVWLLPPFKQFKGKYFLYFLILAFMDPINLLFFFVLKSPLQSQISILLDYCLLLSLIEKKLLRKYWIWVLLITPALFSPTILHLKGNEITLVRILLEVGITLIILKNLITNYVSTGRLSLFLVVFLSFEFTNIAKFSNLLFGFADAFAFYILTTIVQIIFGLFFSVYTESDKTGVSV
ncbi:MAG: hypothetical protein NTX65_07380 [Ignavibacteriales bacterium]|nr:hypothetical protein [Ignavibacteriales bacterium]